jgi:hypothetical protein
MNCPNCGQTAATDARFCGKCGSQVESASGSAAPMRDFGLATASASGAGTASTFTPPQALPGLIERIKNIVLTPKTEWPVIEAESTSVAKLYSGYVMPMAGFAAVMSFIRMSVIGVSLPFGGTIRTPLVSGLFSSVLTFVMGLIGLYLVGLVINLLASPFGGQQDQRQALKTAAYALTPAWLGTALTFLPMGSLLQLVAGIYGIYVLYLGLPVMMRGNQASAGGYTASVVACTIGVGILFGIVAAMLGATERLAGLGGSSAMYDTRSPEAQAAAADRAAGSNADPTQNAMAAAGGLMSALGGSLGGNVRHDPVDFNTLKSLLPVSLPDMQRTNAEGSAQQALGVKSSSASADYRGTDAGSANPRMQIKIADISGISGLLDAASGLVQTGETQSDTGFEKDTVLNGRAVHEKYDRRSGDGEVSAIIAKRFSVEVTGRGVAIGQLEKTLGSLDLARLESMKDAGAH